MSDTLNGKPSTSFWIISAVALVWNLLGFMMYLMQVTATPEALAAAYSDEQVAFIESVPVWAVSAFAIAVNAGLLGCLLLLLRKAWAVPVFIVSLIAVLIQNVHSFLLGDAIGVFGVQTLIIQTIVVVIAGLLVWYSRSAKARGWLS